MVVERVAPVAAVGVHVQVAAQVGQLDQPRQPARRAPARSRRAPRAARAGSSPGRARGRPPPRCAPATTFSPSREPVLVEAQALVDRDAAQLDVVLLAAGEVEQRRAERLGRHQPQVHLQAVARAAPTTWSRRGPAPRRPWSCVGERLHHVVRRRRRRPAGRGRRPSRGGGGTSPPARPASRPGTARTRSASACATAQALARAACGPTTARRSRAPSGRSARPSRRSPAARAASRPSPPPRAPSRSRMPSVVEQRLHALGPEPLQLGQLAPPRAGTSACSSS